MDELLTDLKSYHEHKAFRREAKAGGRFCREKWRQKGQISYSGQKMCKLRQAPVGGREGLQEEGSAGECVPITAQGTLPVLDWWGEEDEEEEGHQAEP